MLLHIEVHDDSPHEMSVLEVWGVLSSNSSITISDELRKLIKGGRRKFVFDLKGVASVINGGVAQIVEAIQVLNNNHINLEQTRWVISGSDEVAGQVKVHQLHKGLHLSESVSRAKHELLEAA